PTVLVDAGIVLSKRALPDEYRQLNRSSRSHVYPFSPMLSVASFSPHSSLAIPTYAPSSLGWSATHQVPSVSFHDSVFDNSERACAAEVAISNAATLVRSKLCPRRVRSRTPAPSRRANMRKTSKVVSEAQANSLPPSPPGEQATRQNHPNIMQHPDACRRTDARRWPARHGCPRAARR